MPEYILRETLASMQQGKPIYFREWIRIGPAATGDLALAHRFPTREAAIQSPAYSHFLSSYEPEEVPEPADVAVSDLPDGVPPRSSVIRPATQAEEGEVQVLAEAMIEGLEQPETLPVNEKPVGEGDVS